MCSEEHFKTHCRPYVLPVGNDPERGDIIPLSEYDYTDEYRALRTSAYDGGEDYEASSQINSQNHSVTNCAFETREGHALKSQVRILVDCVGDMAHRNIIDDKTAYQYLIEKLTELVDERQ